MDDAAELAALRRRAYGPDADIEQDAAALARLIQLENGARGGEVGAAPGSVVETEGRPEVDEGRPPGPAGSRRRRRRWHTALVASVAVVAVLLGIAAAGTGGTVDAAPPPSAYRFGSSSPFTADTTARVLVKVPLNAPAGDHFDHPSAEAAPTFPLPEDVQWAEALGDYYGWWLWLARSRSGLPCLAVVAADEVRADCVTAAEFDTGTLVVTLPYAAVAPDSRPPGMEPTQSLGFQWAPGDDVLIILGRAD